MLGDTPPVEFQVFVFRPVSQPHEHVEGGAGTVQVGTSHKSRRSRSRVRAAKSSSVSRSSLTRQRCLLQQRDGSLRTLWSPRSCLSVGHGSNPLCDAILLLSASPSLIGERPTPSDDLARQALPAGTSPFEPVPHPQGPQHRGAAIATAILVEQEVGDLVKIEADTVSIALIDGDLPEDAQVEGFTCSLPTPIHLAQSDERLAH